MNWSEKAKQILNDLDTVGPNDLIMYESPDGKEARVDSSINYEDFGQILRMHFNVRRGHNDA